MCARLSSLGSFEALEYAWFSDVSLSYISLTESLKSLIPWYLHVELEMAGVVGFGDVIPGDTGARPASFELVPEILHDDYSVAP